MKMEIDDENPIPLHMDLLSYPGTVDFPQHVRIPEKLVSEGTGTDFSSAVRQNKHFSRQYAHTYFIRLSSIRPILADKIRKGWPEVVLKKISGLCESSTTNIGPTSPRKMYNSPKKYSLSPRKLASSGRKDDEHGQHIALHEDVTVAIIGTVFKQQPDKPSILQELGEEIQLTDRTTKESYISEKDVLLLEDETTRVRLIPTSTSGISINGLVNGLVFGVKGRPTIDGRFEVFDVFWPTPSPSVWPDKKYSERSEIVFVSGLQFGSDTENSLELGLLFEHLQGFAGSSFEQENIIRKRTRVFFLGNSIHSETGNEKYKATAANSKKLDRMISCLAQTMEVFVIPGKEDPIEAMYPQPPLHKCLFPLSIQYSTFHLLSNPSRVQIPLSSKTENDPPSLDLILTDGEPIRDAMKFSDVKSSLEMGRRFMEWGHLCPTAPDTMPLHPGFEDDPFIIKDKLPNFFFIGNQKEFGSVEWNGTKVISVPRFAVSNTVVVITKDFRAQTVEFNLTL